MSQKEIEVILARHLASYLAMPIFLVDPEGTLVYYNDPAEKILGLRFAETGEVSAPRMVNPVRANARRRLPHASGRATTRYCPE